MSEAQQRAKENIQHMMNGGRCVHGKWKEEVFFGENGNFYKVLDGKDGVVKQFSEFFHKLEKM